MKKFENPEIEVQVFAVADIVTTSTEQGGSAVECDSELERD